MKAISKEDVKRTAFDFVRKRKNTVEITISMVEQTDGVWIVQGTCPIDLEGHPWTERFEVIIDKKGKITSTDFSLMHTLV